MEQQKSNSLQYISSLIKSSIPYIWVNTYEESRFIKNLYYEIAEKQKKELWVWSSYQGIIPFELNDTAKRAIGQFDKTWNPNQALTSIEEYTSNNNKKGSIWVLKDFNTVLSQPIPRMMRDIYQSLIAQRKNIIILSPSLSHGPSGNKEGLEPTLEKQVVVVRYELPTKEIIEKRIREHIQYLQKIQAEKKTISTKLDYSDEEYSTFSSSLQGLTELEVDNAITTCLWDVKMIDARRLLQEKKQIIQKSQTLEYIEPTTSMAEIGGLDEAKKYFDTYKNQFSKEAREFGVEPLRGVILTGIPGNGKSLLAKTIAAEWNLPLLRLDIGRVMGSLVGSSEERMRATIAQCASIAPCVCWLDEIEKALSGTKSSGNTDGGTLSRVFGTLLTAMEEGLEGVIILATSNDIQSLPPELIRRFNEVMFVDLPLPSEREDIFRIHLAKRKRDAAKLKLNVKEIIAATHLFTGSEIEKVITEAIARAFSTGKKDISQKEVMGAINDTKCIAKVMKDKIDEIRNWARDKARYASSLAQAASSPGAQKVTTKGGKELDLASDLEDLDEVEVPKEPSSISQIDNMFTEEEDNEKG